MCEALPGPGRLAWQIAMLAPGCYHGDMIDKSENKVVLVTGASRGFGRELAIAFGQMHFAVALACKERTDLADETASLIRAAGSCASVHAADQTRQEQVSALVSEVVERFGRIDVFICNAGITLNRLLLRTTAEEWDEVIAVDLIGAAQMAEAVAAEMQERQEGGSILFIGSYAGECGRQGQAAYSAAKAGLSGLTKCLSWELGKARIRVNLVLPGYLPTGMGLRAGESAMATARQENLLKDLADPATTARLIAQLASLPYITGQTINLDSRVLA